MHTEKHTTHARPVARARASGNTSLDEAVIGTIVWWISQSRKRRR